VICPAFFGGIEHFAKLALRSRGRFPRPVASIIVVIVIVERIIRIIVVVGWEVVSDKKHGGEKYSLAAVVDDEKFSWFQLSLVQPRLTSPRNTPPASRLSVGNLQPHAGVLDHKSS
jgi:hypothetical protein